MTVSVSVSYSSSNVKLFEVLKTIDMISSDMTWSAGGMCGKKQWIPVGMGGPAIKCQVNIGGR